MILKFIYSFEYNGHSCTVTEYYKKRYNIDLRHGSQLPLVDVSEIKSKVTAAALPTMYLLM